MIKRICLILLIATSLSACSFVKPRTIPVQQGNKLNQASINQLKPGMTPKQVEDMLGAPVLSNAINANQLNYVYTLKTDKENTQKRLVLTFKNGQLSGISGTLYPHQSTTNAP